jgi:hypothetical protein
VASQHGGSGNADSSAGFINIGVCSFSDNPVGGPLLFGSGKAAKECETPQFQLGKGAGPGFELCLGARAVNLADYRFRSFCTTLPTFTLFVRFSRINVLRKFITNQPCNDIVKSVMDGSLLLSSSRIKIQFG